MNPARRLLTIIHRARIVLTHRATRLIFLSWLYRIWVLVMLPFAKLHLSIRRWWYTRKIRHMVHGLGFLDQYMALAGFSRTEKRRTWRELSHGDGGRALVETLEKREVVAPTVSTSTTRFTPKHRVRRVR